MNNLQFIFKSPFTLLLNVSFNLKAYFSSKCQSNNLECNKQRQ